MSINFKDGYIEIDKDGGGSILGAGAHRFYWDFYREYGYIKLSKLTALEYKLLILKYANVKGLKMNLSK